MADPLRLRQVMDNLISNAVKFSPPASIVRVRASRQDTAWRVEVQDQGPGITPKDRQRLFHDFARLSAEPTGRREKRRSWLGDHPARREGARRPDRRGQRAGPRRDLLVHRAHSGLTIGERLLG